MCVSFGRAMTSGLVIPPLHQRDAIKAQASALAMLSIALDFQSQVTWNLEHLVDDIVEWLNGPQLSTTSKVGIFSSPQFASLIEPYMDAEEREIF